MTPIPSPASLRQQFPASEKALELVRSSRNAIQAILKGNDNRLLVIVGPCSIHDPQGSALEYARRLAQLLPSLSKRFFVVMRTYIEKPRTTIGWEGLVPDPKLTGNFDIAAGLAEARKFLLFVLESGLPTATEFTDPLTPHYLEDAVVWGAVGARSSEAQAYRRMASGLDIPVGVKNGTGGSVQLAVDAIVAARHPHAFLGISEEGKVCQVRTKGNPFCHLVLRGSLSKGANYGEKEVAEALESLKQAGLPARLIVDCSHGNSGKDPQKQPKVFLNVLGQRLAGNKGIIGLMLESHLFAGNQKLGEDPSQLQYGVSITDPCLGWEETEALLREAQERLASSRAKIY